MTWKGKKFVSMGDVMAAALEIKTRAEGKRFFWAYMEACPDLDEHLAIRNFSFGISRFLEGDDPTGEKYRRYMDLILP